MLNSWAILWLNWHGKDVVGRQGGGRGCWIFWFRYLCCDPAVEGVGHKNALWVIIIGKSSWAPLLCRHCTDYQTVEVVGGFYCQGTGDGENEWF